MKLTRKQKLQLSPTARAIRGGMMRFKRRLDIPMFHADHIGQAEQILSDTVDELKRLKQSNSLRDADRLIYAQRGVACCQQATGRNGTKRPPPARR